MCGIAGIISKNLISPLQLNSLQKMENHLYHRGPDGRGEFNSEQVALRMRRLSIIDLEHGWQPLWNEDKSIVLIANGEIYNYIELQALLKSKGHRLRTNSDCETIIHLYEEYKSNFIHYLRGMFAFTLYDINRRKVYIYRDRMGEKPLYYYIDEGILYFSSELRSLFSSGAIPLKFDLDSINDYFHYQFVPEPNTPILNLKKLMPGEYIEIDLNTWNISFSSYWKLENSPELDLDPIPAIKNELNEIHKIQVRSDVPVGVALSGGLDSSSIAALATKHYPGTIQAFSVGYPGRPVNDERSDALKLAKYLKIPIHEIELKTEDLLFDFEKMNFFRDDPIADISGYGYYSISREAHKNGVPVVLQGQGGDELFWGYFWVVEALKLTKINKENKNYQLFSYYFKKNIPINQRKLKYIKWAIELFSIKKSYIDFLSSKKKSRKRVLFYDNSPDFNIAVNELDKYLSKEFKELRKELNPFKLFSSVDESNLSVLFTKLICNSYLLENGIVQGDRLSMASSVELRLPLVDHKLVELVIGLRKNKKYTSDYENFPKPWLREAMKDILPEEIMNRKKKGFSPPILEWYSEIFKNFGNQLINGELVRHGILSESGSRELAKGNFPPGSITPLSFKALILENWFRQLKNLN